MSVCEDVDASSKNMNDIRPLRIREQYLSIHFSLFFVDKMRVNIFLKRTKKKKIITLTLNLHNNNNNNQREK